VKQRKQDAQLSPRDRAMRRVIWNLASCHATVQKLLVRQVLNKSKLWSWRVTVGQCVINMCTQPWLDHCPIGVMNKPTTVELCISSCISNFLHGSAMRSLSLVMTECSLSGRAHGHVSNFYIVDLENFATASRQYTGDIHRWYIDRRRFVHDTYKTVKATRTRHGWVHMFTTHRSTLSLQLHNFDLCRICRTALLRGNWQDFNWHDASRGPSAIAELLVNYTVTLPC